MPPTRTAQKRGILMKPKFNATNGMLCWDPGTDRVEVGPWPDTTGWSNKYERSTLACYHDIRKEFLSERRAIIFIEAIHLIIRDRCDPDAVHRALLNLEEYRDGLSYDMPVDKFV
jgi:hypothetical protein